MKVLFVVNDEGISTSIVKKYQKQYKEIISYKNVYYFNAIIKELQKNKTYDRIVISEDLDEITALNAYQRDKILFDKLDSISDEAVNSNGEDIPIILICNDRRSTSEEILIKLFGIGIYNAIIGADRTTDTVCSLINQPRSKKEAKKYYKIDSENVSYEKEKDNYVSEGEIQNVLRHFKRISGDNKEITDSFRKIVSQYNDEQLKVIIAILPNDIKSVLEEESDEYQRIANKKDKKQSNNQKGKSIKLTQGTSERLLEIEPNKKISKQVVVPTTIEKSLFKKVEKDSNTEIKEQDSEKNELIDDSIEYKVEEILEKQPKRPGRPKKTESITESVAPKKRGRPKKNKENEEFNFLPGLYDDNDNEEMEKNDRINRSIDKNNFGTNKEEEDLYDEGEVASNILLRETSKNKENNSYQKEKYSEDDEEEDFYKEEEEEFYEQDEEKSYEEDEIENNNNSMKASLNEIKDNYKRQEENIINETVNNYSEKSIDKYENPDSFKNEELESLLTADKKIVCFVGTSKNGTSFIVNNIAQILSNMGIDTAILDATKNKNSYYTYTNDDEDLRRKAYNSINNLIKGNANGIKIKNNLTVYSGVPSKQDEINNSAEILETLIKNHSIVLIDCDFDTPIDYFDKSQELYLIQSFDVLTIQPLTEFLRLLQLKNIYFENKIRIILNKCLKIRGGSSKAIIKGMSKYNNEDLSLMKDLFNIDQVKVVAEIPFDEDVYIRYLESLISCEVNINSYPKAFKQLLNRLANIIYPLLPNNNKKKQKKGYSNYSTSFSSDMNQTLDNMRKKY